MFQEGREYRSHNCYRSALSSVIDPIEGFPIGKHPLVCRALKGAFQLRPPLPKYTSIWSVDRHILSWGPNSSLTHQLLSWKMVIRLALSTAGRSSDLSRLKVSHIRVDSSSTVFAPSGLAKQSRSTHLPRETSISAFQDPVLCPVTCLKYYLSVTSALRSQSDKPHKPVVSSTIVRWLKSVLLSAGVDTSVFSAHSTRGASASVRSHSTEYPRDSRLVFSRDLQEVLFQRQRL
jgi:integrase